MSGEKTLLSVQNLTIHYITDDGTVKAVNDVSIELERGKTLGLVGETGAGKTTIALGIMGLIPNPPGKIINGSIKIDDLELLGRKNAFMRKIRGKKISMIFQDPMTALDPIEKVGDQIAEVIMLHENLSKNEATQRVMKTLEMVGIPGERYYEYPHQFSGGMKQRVVIAIALACSPELLIADEPTTALDVTIQAQILAMMNKLKREIGTSMIMITHDLGIIAEMCDDVAVIYGGEIVESGNLVQIFDRTAHPYTIGLFNSLPSISIAENKNRLLPIPGLMVDPTNLPDGCVFSPRCIYAEERCKCEKQSLIEVEKGHKSRCWKSSTLWKGRI